MQDQKHTHTRSCQTVILSYRYGCYGLSSDRQRVARMTRFATSRSFFFQGQKRCSAGDCKTRCVYVHV